MKNKINLSDFELAIDYDLFTTEEVIKIYKFYQIILNQQIKPVCAGKLKRAYHEYRNIINNQALEKKYNNLFYQATGLSIYHIMKNI